MDVVASLFGTMGFIFGMIAFVQVSAATKRIERLEQQLRQIDVADNDEHASS